MAAKVKDEIKERVNTEQQAHFVPDVGLVEPSKKEEVNDGKQARS